MISYLISSVLCSGLFLLAYVVLIAKERIHKFKRTYLLSSLIFSIIIPLINFRTTIEKIKIVPVNDFIIRHSNLKVITNRVIEADAGYTSVDFLILLYTVVTACLLFKFIRNLWRLFAKIRHNQLVFFKDANIILLENIKLPYSFLNYIFVNREQFNKGTICNEILDHELAHIQQRHSLDVLFIEFLKILFWFNPFLYLFSKAIQTNHEYLADEAAINRCKDITTYQLLLLKSVSEQNGLSLTSQFNYLTIKKRLIMMTKKSSLKVVLGKQLLLIPVFATAVLIFSTNTIAQEKPTEKAKKQMPSTQDGISDIEMKEYNVITEKYKTATKKGWTTYEGFTKSDKNHLESLFKKMSKKQQQLVTIIFTPPSNPLKKITPTEKQIEDWRDSKTYGIWIDDRRIENAELNQYKNTDFDQFFVSKLSKNAINYGKHYYQVDLMTKSHYQDYYQKAINNKESNLLVRMNIPKGK